MNPARDERTSRPTYSEDEIGKAPPVMPDNTTTDAWDAIAALGGVPQPRLVNVNQPTGRQTSLGDVPPPPVW